MDLLSSGCIIMILTKMELTLILIVSIHHSIVNLLQDEQPCRNHQTPGRRRFMTLGK